MRLDKSSFELWSNDPPDDKRGLVIGVISSIIGTLLLLGSLAHLLNEPWDLRERGVPTVGIKAERDNMFGDRYTIEVDGAKHECLRGAQKIGLARVTVLYDPANPSRCRAEDTADHLGDYERSSLLAAGPATLLGASLLLAWFAEPRPRILRQDPSGLLRPKLMTVARALLALGVLVIVVELMMTFM